MDKRTLLFLITLLVALLLQSKTLGSYCDGDDAPTQFDRLWQLPATGLEDRVHGMFFAWIDTVIEDIANNCEYEYPDERKCPLTKNQLDELRGVGNAAAERAIRSAEADIQIEIGCLRLYKYPLPSEERYKYRSLSEYRIGMMADLGVMRKSYRMTDEVIQHWKQIATPEQWAKTIKYTNDNPRFNKVKRAKVFEFVQHYADGQLTEKELSKEKIDPNGPRDLSAIPSLDVSSSWVGLETWHLRVALFVRRYKFTPAQQRAASVILEDSLKNAREYRQRHDAQLQRLWKQLLTAYLFPKESNVTVKQAMRQFRRASQAAVRPIYEKMQQRLLGLLTTEQKHNVGPPPPKPKWMELMEIALQDDDAKPLAPIGPSPTTQPALSTGG